MFYQRGTGNARRQTRIETFPAPRRGWVASENLINAKPDAAEVLENIFPTSEGARVRRGASQAAKLAGAVTFLGNYVSGPSDRLFAADATTIYDVTTVSDPETVEGAQLTGFSSGAWSAAQFATAGGDFLVMVNGADHPAVYTGAAWSPLADEAVTNLPYDGLTTDFAIGETVTNGAASAEILGIIRSTATTGVLKVGTITGGAFADDDAITSATGAAVVNGSTSSALAATITGLAGSALSFVWSHKSRLWFVEKDTLSLRYLPAGAIGGALTAFPLQGVFQLGGSVLFGGTVSMDSGNGMDDRLIAVTTEGEMAVYAGTDPSDANAWALEGVYRVGKPLAKNGWFRAGGDLVILTEDGVVSALQAMTVDRAALMASALTRDIEDAWQASVARRQSAFNFSVTLWHSQTLLLIGTPSGSSTPEAFVANTRTGAWARYTGWDVQCSVVHADRLYFGTSGGVVARAETGGTDFGAPYFATWVPKFSMGKNDGQKVAVTARILARVAGSARFLLTGQADYVVEGLGIPAVATNVDPNTWGSGVWGVAIWGSGLERTVSSDWQSVAANGYALSVGVQIGVSQAADPLIELVMAQIQYEAGTPL